MSKLAAEDKFLDLSDYGRPLGKIFANLLKKTFFTPIHITLLFGVSGLIAIYCILKNELLYASFFIILKSIIDAADGELARLNKTPSYVGRYFDSVSDIVLNFLFFLAIFFVSKTTLYTTIVSFCCLQLQGTLYNYYYVILRTQSIGGDKTSKIFEHQSPIALAGETQKSVDIMFKIYTLVYGNFDKIIHYLDKEAHLGKRFSKRFMTFVSIYGLGFQLLIIAIMLPMGMIEQIIPFFIIYTTFIFVFIGIRKIYFK